jgi:membrane protease YdiL (CAAX protease family)
MPSNGTDDSWRLALWASLVTLLILLAYGTRAASGKPDANVLYRWSSVANALIQDGFLLVLVLAIAGFSARRLALRRPRSIKAAGGYMVAAVAAIYVFEIAYSALTHPGNEQGLTPSHWEPRHAAAYVANGVVICLFVPFVEELTFRGLGFTLLERFGRRPAILMVGLLFGLAHGLIASLPVIALFGAVLAWIRARTDSVFPGIAVHGVFNLIALVAAVTLQSH